MTEQITVNQSKTTQRVVAVLLAFVALWLNFMVSVITGFFISLPLAVYFAISQNKSGWWVILLFAIILVLIVKKYTKKYIYFFKPFAIVFMGITIVFFVLNLIAP